MTRSKSGKSARRRRRWTSLSLIIPKTSRRGRGTCASKYGAVAAIGVRVVAAVDPDVLAARRAGVRAGRASACSRTPRAMLRLVDAAARARRAPPAPRCAAETSPASGVSCSSVTWMKRLPNFAARLRITSSTTGSSFEVSTIAPRWMTPAFSARDLAQRVAEVLHVVDADRRDQRGDRLDDVRRVEPPAHPHLEHRDVALRAREGEEGDERQRLEVRRQ